MYRCIDWPVYYMYPNGTNIPEADWPAGPQPRLRSEAEVELALRNFRRLARKLAGDARLNIIGASQIPTLYGGQENQIDRLELLAAAGESLDRDAVAIRDRFTPAEICLGLAEALLAFVDGGSLPTSVTRRASTRADVPRTTDAGALECRLAGFRWARPTRSRSQSLEQGFLVHQLHEWGCPIGLGTFYAAMADALIALSLARRCPGADLLPTIQSQPRGGSFARVRIPGHLRGSGERRGRREAGPARPRRVRTRHPCAAPDVDDATRLSRVGLAGERCDEPVDGTEGDAIRAMFPVTADNRVPLQRQHLAVCDAGPGRDGALPRHLVTRRRCRLGRGLRRVRGCQGAVRAPCRLRCGHPVLGAEHVDRDQPCGADHRPAGRDPMSSSTSSAT